MQTRIKTIFAFVLLIFTAGACGQEHSEAEAAAKPTTFAHFAIRYLEAEQQLRGQVSFSQGDSIETAKPLNIEGGVSFMGSGMKQKDLPKKIIRYDASLRSDFTSPFRFGFKLEGDTTPREITYDMTPVGDFEVLSASKEEGLRIQLHSPVSSTESLLFLFTDSNQEARTILRPGPIDKTVLFIPADALLHFIPGEYRLYLVKTKQEKGVKNGIDAQVIIEFYSKEVAFVLN